jgi:prevent-host-death family protein
VAAHEKQVRFETPGDGLCDVCYEALHMLQLIMNRIINQRELRNQSAAVLREVEAGRTLIVSRNGTPVAELRPIRPHRFVPRATLAEAAARAPRVEAARFRADLDSVIDQRIDD